MASSGGRGTGIGRGGRGIAALQALQQQPPRPGGGRDVATPLAVPQEVALQSVQQQFPRPSSSAQSDASVATSLSALRSASVASTSQSGTSSSPRSLGRGTMMTRHSLEAKKVEEQQTSSVPITTISSRSPSVVSIESGSTPSTSSYISRGRGGFPAPEVRQSVDLPTEQMQKLSIQLPAEEKGKEGSRFPLAINHIPIRIKEGKGVFEYAVMFTPVVEFRQFRFKLISQQRDILGATRTFDGSKLYLPQKLDRDVTVLFGQHPATEEQVQITIKFICEQNLSQCVQHFNILFRRVMIAMELVQIGRHMFEPKNNIPIPKFKLELWPGFITAIQEYEGGLMLLAEVSHRVLRTQTVLEFIGDIYDHCRGRYQDECKKRILGAIVLTRYNNKTYRVDDILWDENPRCTFQDSNGHDICYADYYKTTYDLTVRNLDQPLLLHRVKKKLQGIESEKVLCLIPELCYLTGLTDEMRSDFKVMKDLGSHTRVAPNQRRQTLVKFVENIYKCPKAADLLNGWGIEILPTFNECDGRLMRREVVTFGNNRTVTVAKEADWSRDLCNSQVTRAVDLNNFVVLFCKRDQSRVYEFVAMLQKVGPQLGIQIGKPKMVLLLDDRNDTLMHSLRNNITEQVQAVIIVNPTSRDDRYSLIKKICCIDIPVPSQVINGRTIDQLQKLRSVTQKIILQINCKLGGELWSLEIPLSKLMVIGIDAYHDTGKREKSVLGLVFSVNNTLTRWCCQSDFQTSNQEIGDTLKMFMMNALRKYYEINHFMPEKIIVYRDGVGDGQLEYVSKIEVEQIISGFSTLGSEYNPALTVIVVQKRINTRLFALQGNSLENPPPGTVLDHTVTRKNWYDFFLVSQHVRQGTVTPTHYVVVHNSNSKLHADHLQRMTYKMTHLYYNWPGTVRVPAPCQYAHRLAALVGQHLRKIPHLELTDRLFFL